jgi:DNA-binding NtrC family response regulator
VARAILSVSFNEELLPSCLKTLSRNDYRITSATSLYDAMEHCTKARWHLLVLGHTVPHLQKLALIKAFRELHPSAPVVSMRMAGQPIVEAAEYNAVANDPGELAGVISTIFQGPHAKSSFYVM